MNPLTDFELSDGTLRFVNAAVQAGVAAYPAGGYTAQFAAFDNMTNQTRPIGTAGTTEGERIQAPPGLPGEVGAFVKIQVAALQPQHASWSVPIDVYFKREAGRWKLVGLERK